MMINLYSSIYMKWLQNTILFFGAILLYLHIYLHFKISIFNEFTNVDDVCKQKIMSSIYYKLPFVFDGITVLKKINLDLCKKDKIYTKQYEKMPLLEPSVRFFTNDTIYELKKNKYIILHRNLECRNFYMVHTGKVTVYCIHPKYKDNLILNDPKSNKNIEFIEKNPEILRVDLYPNSILFIPNYWYVFVKANEKSIVEKVQYKTILNEVNFLYDKYGNSK